jgi:hypothetical protein
VSQLSALAVLATKKTTAASQHNCACAPLHFRCAGAMQAPWGRRPCCLSELDAQLQVGKHSAVAPSLQNESPLSTHSSAVPSWHADSHAQVQVSTLSSPMHAFHSQACSIPCACHTHQCDPLQTSSPTPVVLVVVVLHAPVLQAASVGTPLTPAP